MKYFNLVGQIIESEYEKDGKKGISYTLSLLLPGRTVLVRPCNNKNYGAICDLAEQYPNCVVRMANSSSSDTTSSSDITSDADVLEEITDDIIPL